LRHVSYCFSRTYAVRTEGDTPCALEHGPMHDAAAVSAMRIASTQSVTIKFIDRHELLRQVAFVANLPIRSARAVVIAEALSECRICEWFFADAVTGRILQALHVEINDIALEPSVVGQDLPRQRMVAFAKP
jgi:hypothetical protein